MLSEAPGNAPTPPRMVTTANAPAGPACIAVIKSCRVFPSFRRARVGENGISVSFWKVSVTIPATNPSGRTMPSSVATMVGCTSDGSCCASAVSGRLTKTIETNSRMIMPGKYVFIEDLLYSTEIEQHGSEEDEQWIGLDWLPPDSELCLIFTLRHERSPIVTTGQRTENTTLLAERFFRKTAWINEARTCRTQRSRFGHARNGTGRRRVADDAATARQFMVTKKRKLVEARSCAVT